MLIPPFVRFNSVMFYYKITNASQRHAYDHDEYYDAEECTAIKLSEEYEWIQMIREWTMFLQPLKTALKGAEFCFDYPDYDSMLLTRLTHFGKEILPICDNCRSYRFKIYVYRDSSADKLISTILQFAQIDSNVLFEFYNSITSFALISNYFSTI